MATITLAFQAHDVGLILATLSILYKRRQNSGLPSVVAMHPHPTVRSPIGSMKSQTESISL
jgi:hypothetical protein